MPIAVVVGEYAGPSQFVVLENKTNTLKESSSSSTSCFTKESIRSTFWCSNMITMLTKLEPPLLDHENAMVDRTIFAWFEWISLS